MEDNYRHKGLRKKLVNSIRKKGIKDENVLEALNNVPRHLFMDTAFIERAYEDSAFPIGAGQTISQPYTVAFQTELLNVQKAEKVLEVGAGSGYQTCILCELKAKVFSIERQKELYDLAKHMVNKLSYRPKVFYGNGYEGAPSFAPFDKILVTCGAPDIPEDLKKQLKVGGRIVIPIGNGDIQDMKVFIKNGENDFDKYEHGKFSFVPMLSGKDK
ncbi:MAG: protein-L-isoaspartate(D-aspartate) O-methyltransferase [Flavobacteriales bacterium]